MTPSFFALCSKAGIACAADKYKTIYRLHEKLPVVIAVNPASPLPWESIITRYQEQLEPTPQAFFENYAYEFDLFLSTLETEDSWEGLSQEESKIMFLGYGEDDLFPSAYDVHVQIDEDGMMGLSEGDVHQVRLEEPVLIRMQGDFDSVSPLLFGSAQWVRNFFCDRYRPVWKGYVERVSEMVKGEPYEQDLVSKMREFVCAEEISKRINSATDKVHDEMMMGIATFSVEDMVSAVEAIVDANARLGHLASGAPGKPGEVKEIAVVTIPEGVSWIINSEIKRRSAV